MMMNTESFMPHGHCYLWTPDILWMNIIGDVLIFLSYTIIPIVIIRVWRQAEEYSGRWMLLMFAVFIFCCGVTHLIDVFTIWHPYYRIENIMKVITGAISAATAVLSIFIAPKLFFAANENKAAESKE